MTFAKSLLALCLLLSSLSVAFGDLEFVDGGASGASMQQYGTAQARVSLLLTTKTSESILEQSVTFAAKDEAERIVTEHEVTVSQISSNTYNVSVALTFEGWVGDVAYTVSVVTMESDAGLHHSYAAEGKHSVYGVVLYETDASGKKTIVSGDDAPTVSYESYKDALGDARELKVAAHGPGDVKVSDMSVQVRALVGNEESKLLSGSGVTFGEDSVYVAPNKYRVGSGKALVTLEHEGLELHGESFETQFVVEMGKDLRPPPVVSSAGKVEATSASAEASEASFVLEMFNLEGILELSTTIDGEKFVGDVSNGEAESVTFTGPSDVGSGVYSPTLSATMSDGSEVAVVMLDKVEVTFAEQAGTSEAVNISGKTVAMAAGIVGVVIAGLACVAALVAWKSRRDAAEAERSFASSGPGSWADGDMPAAFNIQRDVYGRGSVSADDGSDFGSPSARDSELWQV